MNNPINKTVKKFIYNNYSISFLKEENDNVMVNLTEISRAFPNKNLTNILKYHEMTEYIDSIVRQKGIPRESLIKTVKGNIHYGSGTWAHKLIALRVCQKLSPDFSLWVDERIHELTTVGFTATPDTLEKMIMDPDLIIKLATQLKDIREENSRLNTTLVEQKPKVVFAEAVETSQSSILIGELAKLISQSGYRIGVKELFEYMRESGYLGKRGEYRNIPNKKYIDMGLFEIKKTLYTNSDGVEYVRTTPKVTGKGQIYFLNKFKSSLLF